MEPMTAPTVEPVPQQPEPQPEPPPQPKQPTALDRWVERKQIEELDKALKAWDSGGRVASVQKTIQNLSPMGDGPNSNDANYLAHQIHKPVSDYILSEGTTIPVVVLNGINSDLPGSITGVVRSNVYDSVTGQYLLLPMGTKAIGAYESGLAYGQERIFVNWSRLIFPNGNSIKLDRMEGMDRSGYAGTTGDVNNHWGKLTYGVILGSLLTAGTNISQGDKDVVSDLQRGVAGSTSSALNDVVSRNLGVPPTIEVPPGSIINIHVNKDVILAPYQQG